VLFALKLPLGEDDVAEVEATRLFGFDVSGGGRRERSEQAGRVGSRCCE
jgi:hypothetical protein